MAEKTYTNFNINEWVRVKLTDRGREILQRNFHEVTERMPIHARMRRVFSPPKEDAEGWSEWQLHNLMETFGEHSGLGMVVPFHTEIQFIRRKPEPSVRPEAICGTCGKRWDKHLHEDEAYCYQSTSDTFTEEPSSDSLCAFLREGAPSFMELAVQNWKRANGHG